MEPGEWARIEKREVEWYRDSGGLRDLLKEDADSGLMSMSLRPPFEGLSGAQLLELPLDRAWEWERLLECKREMIGFLRSGLPLSEAPLLANRRPGATLEFYRSQPNGLCLLFEEQTQTEWQLMGYAMPAASHAMLRTAVAWLKAERDGEASFPVDEDPVGGGTLRVDRDRRWIRSTGADLVYGESPAVDTIAGFAVGLDDLVLVVPAWREE